MKARNLVFCILITVMSVLCIASMFMPYFEVTTDDTINAFSASFGDIVDLDVELTDDEDADEADTESDDADNEADEMGTDVTEGNMPKILVKSKNGLTLISNLHDIEVGSTYISRLKVFVTVMLICSWVFAAAACAVVWLLKNKARYIISIIASLLSFVCNLLLYLCVPNIAKHALVEAVEAALFNDNGIYETLLGSTTAEFILKMLGGFCKHLMRKSLRFGFYVAAAAMLLGFIASLVGLILEIVKGGDKKTVSSSLAIISGISGQYAGATVNVGSGIVIGRDAKESNLVINDGKISRRHCRISYSDSTRMFIVTDYSKNGTYVVGGNRLDENVATELKAGTHIQLGRDGDIFRLGQEV